MKLSGKVKENIAEEWEWRWVLIWVNQRQIGELTEGNTYNKTQLMLSMKFLVLTVCQPRNIDKELQVLFT